MAQRLRPRNQKHSSRKVERSRPGIPMPDARGTTEALIQVIGDVLLARLQSGVASHLVVAEKQPLIYRLPVLPGVQTAGQAGSTPTSRSARKLRDSWKKDQYYGFAYVTRGEADLLLCRKIMTCHTGDFIFLLPQTWRNYGNASHWERAEIERADSDLLWLFFNSDGVTIHLCKSRASEHARSPVLFIPDGNFLALLEFFGREVLTPPITGAVTQLLWLIFERALRKLQEKRVVSSIHMLEQTPEGASETGIGEKAKNYIEANLGEKLTLGIVARAVHVSRTKLAQDFSSQNGETFGAYLLRRRLEESQKLLKTTTIPIAHISWMSGFSHPDYFSATFRKHVGMTPTQYRENA
jgi:AraC-like DNA-binding protein